MLNLSNECFNHLFATALLLRELYLIVRMKRSIASGFIFQVKSNKWLLGVVISGLLIYSFSDDQMNIFNALAIVEVFITGVLFVVRNRKDVYVLQGKGIRNLSNGKYLRASKITSVKFDDDQIVFDTTEYQNDLVIPSTKLVSPSWNELTSKLSMLDQ